MKKIIILAILALSMTACEKESDKEKIAKEKQISASENRSNHKW
jgi:hypothetical protein